jgi:hypothetical protein
MTSQESIQRFVEIARRFCQWCEAPPAGESSDILSLQVRALLAEVYATQISLPRVEFAEASEAVRPSEEQRKAIWPKLGALPFQLYNMFYSPTELESEPVMGDLTDDLQDIYCDLQEGLWLHNHGFHIAAAWQWQFSFDSHWGHHAANALYALQGHAGIA